MVDMGISPAVGIETMLWTSHPSHVHLRLGLRPTKGCVAARKGHGSDMGKVVGWKSAWNKHVKFLLEWSHSTMVGEVSNIFQVGSLTRLLEDRLKSYKLDFPIPWNPIWFKNSFHSQPDMSWPENDIKKCRRVTPVTDSTFRRGQRNVLWPFSCYPHSCRFCLPVFFEDYLTFLFILDLMWSMIHTLHAMIFLDPSLSIVIVTLR